MVNADWYNITKETLESLIQDGYSILDIASKYDVNYETARRKIKRLGIDFSKLRKKECKKVLCDVPNEIYFNKDPAKYLEKFDYDDTNIIFIGDKFDEVTLTICISDLHLGHSGFLVETYFSTINKLLEYLNSIKKIANIRKLTIILNGDIISGNFVYKNQEFENVINKWNLQIEFCCRMLTKLFNEISKIAKIDEIIFLNGNHEDNVIEAHTMHLCNAISEKYNSKYAGNVILYDIGEPLGHYNVMFSHGRGYSEYTPVPPSVIRDFFKMINQYMKEGISVERVCLGHTHWLTIGYEMDGVVFDVCGGFQKWGKTLAQRPSGFLMYVFHNNNCTVIPIRPNKEIEIKEKQDAFLEKKNLKLLGDLICEE